MKGKLYTLNAKIETVTNCWRFRVKTTVQWCDPEEKLYDRGVRLQLKHFKMVTQVTWHGKGDYFGSVMPDGQSRSVLISQISKR